MTQRRTISVRTRLRPVRLGFLLPPNDPAALRRAIQIATIRWGGRHCVMIPVYRRLPVARGRNHGFTAKSVIDGFLRAFSPDYLVEMKSGLGSGVDFPSERIITPDHAYYPQAYGKGIMGYGLDVSTVYEDFYNQEFKFQRTTPLNVYIPHAANARDAVFVAASFGEFPSDEEAGYFQEILQARFAAQPIAVSGENFDKLLASDCTSPLLIGNSGVKVSRSGRGEIPFLFYCDSSAWIDIVDCWNFRAAGHRFLPIPRRWAADLTSISEAVIRGGFGPNPRHPEIFERVGFVRSHSCSFEEANSFLDSLDLASKNAVLHEDAPAVWTEGKYYRYSPTTAHEIVGNDTEADVEVISGRIALPALSPTFGDLDLSRNMPGWMNVFQLQEYTDSMFGAPVFPERLETWREVAGEWGMDKAWLTPEGIATPVAMGAWTHHWQAPTALTLMEAWMKENGFDLKVSSAGRITAEIARKLGRYGVNLLGAEDIVRQLNRMAHGMLEIDVDPDDMGKVRKVSSPASSRGDWIGLLKKSFPHGPAETRLRHLLEREVLRLGLRVQCSHCEQHNWYDLDALASRLTCVRCLQEFRFPAESPPTNAWYYRAVGPFAVENYAQGSYSVILAYRFLVNVLRATATWIPSFDLRAPGSADLEADFGMFWADSDYGPRDAVLIFGECKAYNEFEQRDFERMEQLGDLFPQSVLAFCTFRRELSLTERTSLTALVHRTRRKATDAHSPRILVLTGTELFCGSGIDACWRDADRFDQEALKGFEPPYTPRIPDLCKLTQTFHLGLTRTSGRRNPHQLEGGG